jgi:anti-sigma B factor antagonist
MEGSWRYQPLRVEVRTEGTALVIEAYGELDLATAPQLVAQIDALRANGRPSRVLVDLAGVEFCDSTGLRALIGAAAELRAAGGRLAVSAPDGAVSRLIDITGAGEWLDIHPDPAAGLVALGTR